MIPRVNEKIKVGDCYGTIIKVFEPNEYHSGRFIAHIHDKNREYDTEFWFSDYENMIESERVND